ncbi:eCIS core domain-containing protein [Sabulicella glaciei]|uniref:DUF4157 domain-containing protein n=1 Tax=Sabulicella glaciei TaxID=2984948 RepID=A0ABT3NQ51_9PROT|nr:DUF4157 domain-containing protein [Roseococcus sp. MDT2-1-1]MCW8084277.1 DUF4157 domain-containing protein [Roseococcus sp. MDT2-1-1]
MKSGAALQAREAAPDPTVQAPEPALPTHRPRPAARGDRHFAEVPAAVGGGDPDGEALKALLTHLAGQMGMRPGSLEVRVGPEAERLASVRRAAGVAHDGIIHIPQARLAPCTPEGRRLIAHEAAHVAQMRRTTPARPSRRDHARAEVEAETLARRYVATRVADPVRRALSPRMIAADVDYEAVAAAAAKNHPEEIAAITDLLSYGFLDWAITDGDISDILQILASYIVPVARGIMGGLEPKYRKRFFSNLDGSHYAAHRAEILAAAWAVPDEAEFAEASFDVLARMRLQDLGPEEAIALDGVVRRHPRLVKAATDADASKAARIDEARAYVTSGKAASDGDKEITEGLAGEQRLTALREDAARLREDARKADPNGEAFAARVAERIDAADLTGADAQQILADIAAEVFRVLDRRLAAEFLAIRIGVPRINRLLERIPARALYGNKALRDAFVHLAAVRPAYLNAKLAEDLATSPWWKVWDDVAVDEAYTAYLLVKALPVRGRAAFLKARGGEKWGPVLEALPASVREDPAFNFYGGDRVEKGREETDRQGLLMALMDDKLWEDAAQAPAAAPPKAEGPEASKDAAAGYDPLAKLEALIRLAEAADERLFAFEQSRRQAAWIKARLQPLVEAHRLYWKGRRETYQPPVLPSENQGGFTWGKLLFGLRNFSLDLKTGALGVDVNLSDATEVSGIRFREGTGERPEAGKLADNVMHVEYGPSFIVADAPKLVIERLASVGESAIHAGPITCSGLHLDVRFVPGMTRLSMKRLLSLDLRFDELVIEDVTFAGAASLFGFKSLRMTGAELRVRNQAIEDSPEAVWIWKILDVLMAPEKATNTALAFDLLALRSVATSGGLFVDSVEIEGFAIQSCGDASAYDEALIRSLGRLKPRAAAERDAARSDPDHAEQHNRQAERIERQIAKTQAELGRGGPHGAVVDIRAIRISGVPGISEEPLAFEDIHGQGHSVTAIVPLFADPTSIRNMIRGTQAAPAIRNLRSAEEQFSIDIGRIEAKKPLRLAGGIPSASKAQEEYDEYIKAHAKDRFDPHWAPVEAALRDRAAQARRYWELAAKGVQFLGEDEARAFRQLRAALTAFEERRALIVESLELEGVSLNIGADGNPELIAETFKTSAIRTFGPDGAETFSIGGVEARNVAVGAALQGGLANYKEWRKALQSGSLKAEQLTLKDIRHAGLDASIEELTFESEGDLKALDVTFNRGKAETGGASALLRSGKIRAKGLNAPTQMALIKAEKARIEAIRPESDRTKEELKRLQAIDRMLRDYDFVTTAKAKAESDAATAKTTAQRAAAAKALAKAEQALRNWQDRLVVEKLTVDQLDLAISGLGDVLAEGYSFDKKATELTVKGGTEGQPWFQKVEAEGIRRRGDKGDQTVAERITIGPVAGEVKRTKNGYALNGFTVASVAVKGLSWRSGETSLQSVSESRLEGLSIDAVYAKDGGATRISITRAGIQRIVADQLRYESPSAVVTVKSGALVGISVTGLDVTLPEEGDAVVQKGGEIAVRQVQALALEAVVGGKKIVGQVDSKTPAPEASAIKVQFADAGGRTLSLTGLVANAQVTDLKTGGRLNVSVKNISGEITQKTENDFEVRNLSIPDVTLSGIHWIAGDYTIDVADKVTLAGIMLDADASLRPRPPKKGETPKLDDDGKPVVEKELGKLLVQKLTVSEIAARAVKVTSPRIEPKAGSKDTAKPEKTIELKEAVIRGLRITGFDVLNRTGKVEVTQSVKVTDLKATIGAEATRDLKKGTASFTIYGKDAKEPGAKARELSAMLTAKDGTTLKLGRTQDLMLSDVDLLSEVEGKPGETTRTGIDKVTVPGISVGGVLVKEDQVVIEDLEVDGPVEIAGVHWKASAGGKSVEMKTAKVAETLKIKTIDARFTKVPVKDPKPGEDPTTTELAFVSVKGLGIPSLEAKGLTYEGPSDEKDHAERVKVDMPEAVVEGIVLDELTKDFAANTLTVKGGKMRKLTAPHFVVTLSNAIDKDKSSQRFAADVTADNFTADAVLKTTKVRGEDQTKLAEGGFKITTVGLKHIVGREIPSQKGKAGWSFGVSGKYRPKTGPGLIGDGFNAELSGAGYDAKGASIESAKLHSFNFHDPAHGITLDIQDLEVPKGITVPNEGEISLPEGVITNASFKIDDLNALVSGGPAGKEEDEDLLTKAQRDDLLDHINGTITGEIYVPLYLFSAHWDWYLRQDVFPLDLRIVDGKLDYATAWKKATWLRNDLIASLGMDSDPTMGISGDVVPGDSYLTLEVAAVNQKIWTPGDETERKEMEGGEVRLKRLIAPDGSDVKKPKKYDEHGKEIKERPMVNPDEIELRKVDASLDITGGTRLDLGKDGKYGTIKLGAEGRNAISGLKVRGENKNSVTWKVGGIAVTLEKLNIMGNQIAGKEGKPAELLIDGITDGQLDFHGGKVAKPGKLEGTINSATIRNLALTRGKK